MARTYVITGASSGIGAAAAGIISRHEPNSRLVVVGRNPDKTKAVAEDVGAEYHLADFESLGQVRTLAANLHELGPIYGLANNAGGIFDGPLNTADGFERTWQVNVVAPLLLTALLKDQVRLAVQTASLANLVMSAFKPADPNTFHRFSPERAYGNAKLGDILLTRYLHLQGIPAVAFHPGVLSTGFSTTSKGLLSRVYASPIGKFMGGADDGAQLLAHFLTGRPGVDFESGEYYNERLRPGWRRPIARKDSVARHLFDDLTQQLDVRF